MEAGAHLVSHSDRLVAILGAWPTFHDAEVLRLRLDRSEPSLEAIIDVQHGPNAAQVTLRFHAVTELELGGLNAQNVLFDLTIESVASTPGRCKVGFNPSYGLGADFECGAIEVINAVASDAAA